MRRSSASSDWSASCWSGVPLWGPLLVLLACGDWCGAAAPQYTAQDLGNFKPTGLNNQGQVVGYWTDGDHYWDGHSLSPYIASM